MTELLDPIRPGEILLDMFLAPMGLSQSQLARDIDVPVNRITGIVKGERAITADTALRLGRYFGTTPKLWLNMQAEYDLRRTQREKGAEIERRVRRHQAA